MQELLKSKLILYFALFGAVFSLLLGLFSKVPAAALLLRVLLSGVAMGIIGLGLKLLVSKFIPEEHINDLMGKDSAESGGMPPDEGDSVVPPHRVDITDDDSMSPEDIYRPEEDYRSPSSGGSGDYDDGGGGLGGSGGGAGLGGDAEDFKEIDFSQAPKVQPSGYGDDEMEQDIEAEAPTDEKEEMIRNELDRLKEKARSDNTPSTDTPRSSGDGSFKVGNTKVTADPKVIAKAIRTVLNRD